MLVLKEYGNQMQFLSKLSPSAQKFAGRHPERAHFGNAPTLTIMNKTYGEGFAASWLLPQILDLVAFSNSKGTLNEAQMEFLAESIANEYYFLKASELLLFFYRFKCGTYGKFYGNVDPMAIMQGLEKFMKERRDAHRHHEEEELRKERDELSKKAISVEEYCQKRGLPAMTTMDELIKYANVNPPTD